MRTNNWKSPARGEPPAPSSRSLAAEFRAAFNALQERRRAEGKLIWDGTKAVKKSRKKK